MAAKFILRFVIVIHIFGLLILLMFSSTSKHKPRNEVAPKQIDMALNQNAMEVTKNESRTQAKQLMTIKENTYVVFVLGFIYGYSAVELVSGDDTLSLHNPGSTITKIAINGWELRSVEHLAKLCCFVMLKGSGKCVKVHTVRVFEQYVDIRPVQYQCKINVESENIKSVTIVLAKSHTNKRTFRNTHSGISITKPVGGNLDKVAICSHLNYGSFDARMLIEWFEVQRLLGVEKVVSYTYKLNSEAMAVFEYYQSIGLAFVIPDFDFPLKDVFPREVGQKNALAFIDKQVLDFDCQARLSGYKYVVLMDKDEFLIPNITRYGYSLQNAFEHIFKSNDNLAGFHTYTKLHITDWGATNEKHPLFIGKYMNSSLAVYDRRKSVFMPSRTIQGTLETHNFEPRKGYYKQFIPPEFVVMHHYRDCRQQFNLEKRVKDDVLKEVFSENSEEEECFRFRKLYQYDMENVVNKMEENAVIAKRKLLNNF